MYRRLLPISAGLLAVGLNAIAAGEPATRTIELGQDKPKPAVVKMIADQLLLIYRFPGVPARVAVIDRKGAEQFAHAPAIDVQDAPACTILDATITRDAVLVASVALLSRAGQGTHALLEYDLGDKRLIRMVRTTPLRCDRVVGDTGSVWCLGVNNELEKSKADYDVVVQLSLTGDVLRSAFPRSTLSSAADAWEGPTAPVLVSDGVTFAAWLPASHALLRWGASGNGARHLELVPRATEDQGVPDQLTMRSGGMLAGLLAVGNYDDHPEVTRRALFTIDDKGNAAHLSGTAGEETPRGWFLAGSDGDAVVFYNSNANAIEWLPLQATGR